MSDCRFGVSPVNYPDPDPDFGAYMYRHNDVLDNVVFSIEVMSTLKNNNKFIIF